MSDNVNHPSHYTQGGVECIEALDAATSGLTGIEAVCTANAIKYLWRWKHKNGIEDLEKAKWYIQKLIDKESCTEKSYSVDQIEAMKREGKRLYESSYGKEDILRATLDEVLKSGTSCDAQCGIGSRYWIVEYIKGYADIN